MLMMALEVEEAHFIRTWFNRLFCIKLRLEFLPTHRWVKHNVNMSHYFVCESAVSPHTSKIDFEDEICESTMRFYLKDKHLVVTNKAFDKRTYLKLYYNFTSLQLLLHFYKMVFHASCVFIALNSNQTMTDSILFILHWTSHIKFQLDAFWLLLFLSERTCNCLIEYIVNAFVLKCTVLHLIYGITNSLLHCAKKSIKTFIVIKLFRVLLLPFECTWHQKIRRADFLWEIQLTQYKERAEKRWGRK